MNIRSLKIKCFPSKSIGDFSFGKNCIVTAAIQVQSFHVLVITPQLEKKPFSEVVHDSYSIPQQSGIRLGKKTKLVARSLEVKDQTRGETTLSHTSVFTCIYFVRLVLLFFKG